MVRSRPIVVAWPCPGSTSVSSASGSTRSRSDLVIAAVLPPGRSVRPIEPANSTSPESTVAGLRKAEQAALRTATAAVKSAPPDRVMLVGSIAACRAGHAEALA